jgi:cytochrome c-type biogenesis protein
MGSPAEVVLDGSLLLAMLVALAAGVVSFLSPCVLPLLPAYLSYVSGLSVDAVPSTGASSGRAGESPGPTGQGSTMLAAPRSSVGSRGRVVAGTALFVLGFTVVFVAAGALLGGLGAALVTWQRPIGVVLGLLTVVLGLILGGWLPVGQRDLRLRYRGRLGLAAAPALGVVFGLGWTPCLGPTLAAVQVLAVDQASAGRGAILAAAYCVGLGLPFLLVGLGLRHALLVTGWASRHALGVQRVGGAMLVLLGVALVTGLWGQAVAGLQGWISSFEVLL